MGMDQPRAKQVDSSSSALAQTKTAVWLSLRGRLTQTPASCTALKKAAAKSKLWNWDLALDQVNVLVELGIKTHKVDIEKWVVCSLPTRREKRKLFQGLSKYPNFSKPDNLV